LAASLALYGRAPEAVLYTVPVESTAFGFRLSQPVQTALERLVIEIVDIIHAIARES
jgi:hypothetical protein